MEPFTYGEKTYCWECGQEMELKDVRRDDSPFREIVIEYLKCGNCRMRASRVNRGEPTFFREARMIINQGNVQITDQQIKSAIDSLYDELDETSDWAEWKKSLFENDFPADAEACRQDDLRCAIECMKEVMRCSEGKNING